MEKAALDFYQKKSEGCMSSETKFELEIKPSYNSIEVDHIVGWCSRNNIRFPSMNNLNPI